MFKRGGKTLLILGLAGASFFIFELLSGLVGCEDVANAQSEGVVINEIMIGQTGAAKNELIELYNNGNTDIDLSGFSLKKMTKSGTESNLVSASKFIGVIPAKGYFLISHPEFAEVVGANLVYSGSSYSIAGNNTIVLYNSEDGVVDMVGYGEATNFETSAAPEPDNNQSISRQPDGKDSDDNSADFVLLENPTPQSSLYKSNFCGDGDIDSTEECDDGNNLDGDGCDSECKIESSEDSGQVEEDEPELEETTMVNEDDSVENKIYKLGRVVINEFVSDPGDGDEEWVELYNTTDEIIDLDGWTIEEGSGAITKLSGSLGSEGSEKYFIVEKPKGNLNNKGDIIILRSSNILIDQVAYGDWDDGNLSNNTEIADDPNSLARKMDGYNTYNNANDFAATTKPTKGESNIIENIYDEDEEISFEDKARYDYSTGIIISEIFPNPEGEDSKDEFIELYNTSDKAIKLFGWQLGDETKNRYVIDDEEMVIGAKEFKSIYRSESKIALNNGGDTVKLFQPLKDEPLRIVKFEKSTEGWSYNAKNENNNLAKLEWEWSETVTPDKENIFWDINHVPVVDFYCPEVAEVGQPVIFDSSDTVDEDGDELEYGWDFGDGFKNNLYSPGHTYLKAGAYTVRLIVADGENEVIKEKIIQVVENINSFNNSDFASTTVLGWEDFYQEGIIINEIMPNPGGTDAENEWIEIYNHGDSKINLLNWRLDDEDGGSKPYNIINDLWLEPESYYVFGRPETGIALNNTTDSVCLYNNSDIIVDSIDYVSVVEGEAYARGENEKWFWTSSPTPGNKNFIVVSGGDYMDDPFSLDPANKKNITYSIELGEVNNLGIGDQVITRGIVTVLPGVIGSQYFYIASSSGLQVYNYKKDFPEINLGDYIEVSGELSEANSERRLKTKQASDIVIIERRESPMAEKINCEKINEDIVGSLISVNGIITEKKSSSIFLDDGTDEALVYIKKTTGINLASLNEGDNFEITGVVGKTSSGVRIMPRSSDDVIRQNQQNEEGKVLGEVSDSDEWEISQRDKKQELLKYLLITSFGMIILLFGLLVKEKFISK